MTTFFVVFAALAAISRRRLQRRSPLLGLRRPCCELFTENVERLMAN